MIRGILYFLLGFYLVFLHNGCTESETLFKLKTNTGIDFQNTIEESDVFNILTNELIYNGGGVGIGDFNNDNLQDIYFTGNMVSNKLYLNKGNLKFRDISEKAGVTAAKQWSTGVTVVDINQDGWEDIYVCSGGMFKGGGSNMLFINNGIGKDGIPTFTESALEYGVDDKGNSTHATFFDYDNDLDLDLYVLTDQLEVFSPNKYRPKNNTGLAATMDQLYRNDNGKFVNVSKAAGIVYEGYGLGLNIVDINEDGWKDIYVSNDFLTNDLLYINNQDGTFANKISDYIKHQTHSAMGNDVGDINNDGRPDIITVDMLPADNQRLKKMQLPGNYLNYSNNERFGYELQVMRNTLQLNNGKSSDGQFKFSEIGISAGVHASDWSWAPLLADFDNDGYRDLVISNGFPKDITDLDFSSFRHGRSMAFDRKELLNAIPEAKISNFIFRNNGNLTFSNQSISWGLDNPSFSNGAAYADLDNDGDLDLIFNNINDKAFIYENRADEINKTERSSFLRFYFSDFPGNIEGLGTKIRISHSDGQIQYAEFAKTRGYISSVEPFVHFGVGDIDIVESVEIIWPDGKLQKLENVRTNQTIGIEYLPDNMAEMVNESASLLFQKRTGDFGTSFKHSERTVIDYDYQRLIPHQFSQRGPYITTGDIDNNGEEDFYIGGSLLESGTFFMQKNGQFQQKLFEFKGIKKREDTGVLLFDIENDGNLDLYVASGGYGPEFTAEYYQDRLYLGDGRGGFAEAKMALPTMITSSSCVRGSDFDKDGDLDLFIGGLFIPGQYPRLPSSHLLVNNYSSTRKFEKSSINLESIGHVSDAIWTDYNADGWTDLVLVGEWMPLTFLKNNNGQLEKESVTIRSEDGKSIQSTGWWNCISGGDFDGDGDVDYIIGNHGTNSIYKGTQEEPLTMLCADFDDNGQIEGIIGSYNENNQGIRRLYPVHSKGEINAQVPLTQKKFLKYEKYANATLFDLFTDESIEVDTFYASVMWSAYLENFGIEGFKLRPLPFLAQLAPIFDILTMDLNDDGNLDALLIGNDHGNHPLWGKLDAFNGLTLMGKGDGNFETKNYDKTGFLVPGDAKSIAVIERNNLGAKDQGTGRLIVVGQNKDSLQVFELMDLHSPL